MKTIFTVVFISLVSNLIGQNRRINCNVLKKVLESEGFLNRFSLCKSSDIFYLEDTSKSFTGCASLDVCNMQFEVISSAHEYEEKKVIKIYKIEKKKTVFKLYFHRISTGTAYIVGVRSKNGKVRILWHKSGAF